MEFELEQRSDHDGKPKTVAVPDKADLDEMDTRAKATVKDALGMKNVDLTADNLADQLRPKLRDAEVETFHKERTKTVQTAIGQATVPDGWTHRYTIFVPEKGEDSVLNLGHQNDGRELLEPGISARTSSQIHLHTRKTPSVVVLGGPTKAAPDKPDDPKKVLESNKGIGAVTNGHIWAEAKGQLNLAARDQQAVLRSHKAKVRVQADDGHVELGAGGNVAIGAKKDVKIVAEQSVAPGDNAYGAGFDGKMLDAASSFADKYLVSVADIASSAISLTQGMQSVSEIYSAKKNKTRQDKNDIAKLVTDAVKLGSTIGRFVAGIAKPTGQVKIAAETMASLSGGAAASMYGRLSSSVTSLVSASVIGGTASLKGLSWASVWASLGVSIRTVTGKAGLASERGKVSISGGDGVNVSTPKTVSIGGNESAELKSKKSVYVSGGKTAKVVAGEGDGAGLIVDPKTAYIGGAASTDQESASAKHDAFVEVKLNGAPKVTLETSGSHLHLSDGKIVGRYKTLDFKGDEIRLKSKKVHIG